MRPSGHGRSENGGNSTKSRMKRRPGIGERGRPSSRTEKLEEEMLDHLRSGMTIYDATLQDGMPTRPTWWRWKHADPGLAKRELAALSEGAHAMVDSIIHLADTAESRGEDPRYTVARIRVRQWVAERRNQVVYGARLDHGLAAGAGETLADVMRALRIERDSEAGDEP